MRRGVRWRRRPIATDPDIRTEEYALFKSERIAKRLAGDELIGMRGLRDELRRGPYAATKADSPGRRAAG